MNGLFRARPGAARVSVAGVFLLGLALAGTAALSQVRYGRATGGTLRLSWRVLGERVEECRHPTAEEVAKLPAHMRQAEICEGRVTPFLLHLSIDGRPSVVDTIRASGAREDRPIYVFRELRVDAGEHDIAVRFEKLGARAEAGSESAGSSHVGRAAATPALLELNERVRFGAGEIGLVTYDQDARTLVLRRGPAD